MSATPRRSPATRVSLDAARRLQGPPALAGLAVATAAVLALAPAALAPGVLAPGDLAPLVLLYALPTGLAALRSRRAGLVLAALAGGAHAAATALAPATPPEAPAPCLTALAGGASLGLLLAAGAWLLAGRAAAGRAADESRRWQAEALRQADERQQETEEARRDLAAERAREQERLQRHLRGRAAPTLQVAHQLRAPVAAVQSALDVVLQGYVDHSPEQQRRLLQQARDSAAEMLALTSDVLRLGELRDAVAGPPRDLLDVAEIADRIAESLRPQALLRSLTLTVHIAPGLPTVRAGKLHLEELLRNLLDNAVKYNLPGGHVWLRLWPSDGDLRGEVGDTGIGIRERDLPRIFDEFFRAENARESVARGTGLGLPIVKQVVELYGGSVEVRSQLGKGTVFTFHLPGAGQPHPPTPRWSCGSSSPGAAAPGGSSPDGERG